MINLTESTWVKAKFVVNCVINWGHLIVVLPNYHQKLLTTNSRFLVWPRWRSIMLKKQHAEEASLIMLKKSLTILKIILLKKRHAEGWGNNFCHKKTIYLIEEACGRNINSGHAGKAGFIPETKTTQDSYSQVWHSAVVSQLTRTACWCCGQPVFLCWPACWSVLLPACCWLGFCACVHCRNRILNSFFIILRWGVQTTSIWTPLVPYIGIQFPPDHWHDPFLPHAISMVAPTWCHGPIWENPVGENVDRPTSELTFS